MRKKKKNLVVFRDDYVVIKIDNYPDKECLIDLEDYERIKDFTWGITIQDYACTKINKKHFVLHRLIYSLRNISIENLQIDHINRNRLDNRFKNLRICSLTENHRNVSKIKNKTSKYKGVCFVKSRNKFICSFASKDHNINYNKRFNTELEAAQRYNELASQYFGEFANLNKIE